MLNIRYISLLCFSILKYNLINK